MDNAVHKHVAAIEDVYEGPERLKGIFGKLGDFPFLFARIVGWNTIILCT
jgi:hypothetical protein